MALPLPSDLSVGTDPLFSTAIGVAYPATRGDVRPARATPFCDVPQTAAPHIVLRIALDTSGSQAANLQAEVMQTAAALGELALPVLGAGVAPDGRAELLFARPTASLADTRAPLPDKSVSRLLQNLVAASLAAKRANARPPCVSSPHRAPLTPPQRHQPEPGLPAGCVGQAPVRRAARRVHRVR